MLGLTIKKETFSDSDGDSIDKDTRKNAQPQHHGHASSAIATTTMPPPTGLQLAVSDHETGTAFFERVLVSEFLTGIRTEYNRNLLRVSVMKYFYTKIRKYKESVRKQGVNKHSIQYPMVICKTENAVKHTINIENARHLSAGEVKHTIDMMWCLMFELRAIPCAKTRKNFAGQTMKYALTQKAKLTGQHQNKFSFAVVKALLSLDTF